MSKSSPYVNPKLRKTVIVEANDRCEYCRIKQAFIEYLFHLDHIISLKHGGLTNRLNLCLACPDCNFNKGTNLGTYLFPPSRNFTPLFHPRIDIWEEHFREIDGFIEPLTEVGEATARILMFNTPERIILRRLLSK
jgi:HNH endonuclease